MYKSAWNCSMCYMCHICQINRKPVLATNVITGQQLKFESITQASKTIVTTGRLETIRKGISDALAGRRKTAYGYTWEYVD